MDSTDQAPKFNEQGNIIEDSTTSQGTSDAPFVQTTTTTTVVVPESAQKPPKIRGHICLYFFMIVTRFICLIAGVAELGYGGWIFYYTGQIKHDNNLVGNSFLNVITGAFVFIAGLAIIAAELRTRWTAQRTVKVFIFLGSWVGRGCFYLAIGLLNIPITIKVYNLDLVQGKEFAALVGLAGLLSICMHPFFWHLERVREQARQTWIAEQVLAGVELESIVVNPSENNTGLTMFDPKLAKLVPAAEA